MAPAKVPTSKQPIEQYNETHIMSREKKIITDELLREHKRAESLAKAVENIIKVMGEVDVISKREGSKEESMEVGKLRLGKDVTDIMNKLNSIKFDKIRPLFEPAVAIITDDDLDDTTDKKENDDGQDNKRMDRIETKTYKLDPNTKVFTGSSGERLSQWIFIINDAFTSINVTSDKIKLALITNYVKGMALNTLMRYKTEENPSWDGFVKLLKEQYEDSNLDYKLRTQFFHLKMETSFPRYLAKFHELLNQLPSLTYDNQTVLDRFTDGLSKEMAFHVKREKCKTLNQAIEICNDLNCLTLNDEGKNEKINFTRTNFNSNKGHKSFNKHSVGKFNRSNTVNRQPFKRFENRKSNSFVKPYTKTNSFVRNNINNSNFSKRSNEKYKVDLNKVTCYKCKKTGHYSNKCMVKSKKIYSISIQANSSKSIDTSLLNVNGYLNGIPTVFTLDTAATATIISEKFAKSNNIKFNESDTKVKVANDNLVEVAGQTDELHIEIKSHTCKLKMFVLPNSDFEVLLGLNWFIESGCSVNPAQRTLQFKSENFSLDDNNIDMLDEEDAIFFADINSGELDDIDTFHDWGDSVFTGIKPICEVSKDQMRKIDLLSKKIKNNFAKDYKELGRCTLLPYKINLINPDEIVNVPQYRKSIVEHDFIDEEVKKMLEADIIEVSNSPYQSPVLVVNKKVGEDGIQKKRFCLDFRKLNSNTISENLPTPQIRDIYDKISGSKFFSLFDLNAAYFQNVLHKDSRKYTAFCTRTNKFQFKVLPYGVKNGVGGFCRTMELAMGHLQDCCLSYVDDLICFSPTFDQHLIDIEKVFLALEKANLKVSAQKCKWFAFELKLLGFIVSGTSMKTDPSKIKAIEERKRPTNVKETQIFLGCCSYYRNLIKDFAKIAKPLFELLKKENKFEWENEHQNAFETLKNKLKESPIVRLPVLDRPFIVYTDSSSWALGCYLAQVCPETGQEYVVSYGSRLLKDAEKYYSVCEKELLAIIYALNLWKVYLCKKFKIITDAKAITYITTHKSPNPRLVRLMIFIQGFDFELIYRKGSDNQVADFLSRPVRDLITENTEKLFSIETNEFDEEELNSRNIDALDDDSLIHYLTYGRHMDGISQKQKRRIDKIQGHYKMDNGLWYRKNTNGLKWVKYPPKEIRNDLILSAHSLGHFGVSATLNRLQERYFWKKMSIHVESTVKRCSTCQRHKRVPVIHHEAISIECDSIFDHIIMDCSFGFPLTKPENYHGILVLMCKFTKFPFVYLLKTKSMEEIAEKLLDFICLVSPFKTISSDRGKEFVNSVVEKLLTTTGIDRRVSSAYKPTSQGLVEKFNSTIAASLRKCAEANTDSWHKFVPFVLLAYRTKIHESTKMSPYSLVFGREANHFENWSLKQSNNETNELFHRSIEIKNLVEEKIPKAKENLEKAKSHQLKNQNNRNNVETQRLKKDQVVYIKNEGLLTKLSPRFIGPYKIDGDATGGNYYLKNNLGERMKLSSPREKLKLVETNLDREEIDEEIESILNDKIVDNIQMYEVKWKNSTDSSWLPLDTFDVLECVNKYNREKQLMNENITRESHKNSDEIFKDHHRIQAKKKNDLKLT